MYATCYLASLTNLNIFAVIDCAWKQALWPRIRAHPQSLQHATHGPAFSTFVGSTLAFIVTISTPLFCSRPTRNQDERRIAITEAAARAELRARAAQPCFPHFDIVQLDDFSSCLCRCSRYHAPRSQERATRSIDWLASPRAEQVGELGGYTGQYQVDNAA